jgi:hypothetical protein
MRQENAVAKVVSSGEGSKSSKEVEKTILGAKMVPVIVRSEWEHEEEGMLGGKRWNKEENRGEDDSDIYIDDILDLEDAMEHGKGREWVSSQPPVVTRSGRVVRQIIWVNKYHPQVFGFPVIGGHPVKQVNLQKCSNINQ